MCFSFNTFNIFKRRKNGESEDLSIWKQWYANIKVGRERQMCYRITCKGYERKECVHEGKERIKGRYSAANIDVWIRNDYEIGVSSQEFVLCKCVN